MSGQQDRVWSGLETDAMKEARCSLLLPESGKYQPKITCLHKQKAIVYQDAASKPAVGLPGGKSFYVDFQGCTVLQLEPSPKVKHKTMPVTLTVGGRCNLTNENYRDFGMMMRTKDQAETIDVAANGSFDWPDVESFLMCPMCSKSAPIPQEDSQDLTEYWLLFYPLLQINIEKGNKMVIASRTICRLACLDCTESLLAGMRLAVKQAPTETDGRRPSLTSFSLSAMEILEEAGTAAFLQDSPPRPESLPNVDDELDAWTLYKLWEHSGAWEALQNDYKTVLSRSMQATMTVNPSPTTESTALPAEKVASASKAKERYGRKCGSPSCNKVHGKKGEETDEVVRLTVVCEQCHGVYYCSKTCRKAAAAHHKGSCAQRQVEERERHDSRLKKIQCDVCKKVLPCTQMKKCSRCRASTYCSVDCQRQDWVHHKTSCVGTVKP
jgi:hypothetical protein